MVLVVVSVGATDNTSSGGILTLPVCVFGAMLRSLFPGVLSINHKTTSAAARLPHPNNTLIPSLCDGNVVCHPTCPQVLPNQIQVIFPLPPPPIFDHSYRCTLLS